MIGFSPAKVNLGLHITDKRADGFHNLETVFYQFPLKDVLEIVVDGNAIKGSCHFRSTGLTIPSGKNLCEKAYELLHQDYDLPAVKIHLHKVIPIGAGLGGGSSNATHTIKLLNELFHLNLSKEQLKDYALSLGSDCPLFIEENVQYAEGRGEILTPLNIDLSSYYLLIVNPKIHISTADAFQGIQFFRKKTCLDVVVGAVESWRLNLQNDFESSIFTKFPEIKDIKDTLYSNQAVYASMSGSGSTVYALFDKEPKKIIWPDDYFVWSCKL